MKFQETRLPRHPDIEQAFEGLLRFFNGDAEHLHFTTGLATAKALAETLQDKNPSLIAAALIIPAIDAQNACFDNLAASGCASDIIAVLKKSREAIENPQSAEADTMPLDPQTAKFLLASAIVANAGIIADLLEDEHMQNAAVAKMRCEEAAENLSLIKRMHGYLIECIRDEEPGLAKAVIDSHIKAMTALSTFTKPAEIYRLKPH